MIQRETIISGLVNAAISAGFFIGAFGHADPIPVRGLGNLAFDFVPQSAAVVLMSSLVPTLLARRVITAAGHDAPSVPRILVRAARNTLAAAVLGVLLGAAMWLFGPDGIARSAAFAGKVAYGALLGATTTRFELRRALP